jgi:uncharacterized protein
MKKIHIFGLMVTVAAILLYFASNSTVNAPQDIKLHIGDTEISVEIVDTEATRELGLSGRNRLDENSGMLFVFPEKAKYGFWMKDMKFSIDIVWIDGNRVVGIEKSISPSTYPAAFYPPVPVQHVLELPSGFSDRAGLEVNDFLSGEF